MWLNQRHFREAKSEAMIALAKITPEITKSLGNAEAEVKGMLGLAEIYLGESAKGRKLCEEAVQIMSSSGERSSGDYNLDLLLAEGLLQLGDAKGAQASALKAQKDLVADHHLN